MHKVRAFWGVLGGQGWRECRELTVASLLGSIPSALGPSHPLPHSPRSHLIPWFFGPSNLAYLSPQPPPSSSLHFLGEVGHKGWIFPPAPSSSLAFLPPGAGRGQRKQSAAPAHARSLPHFLLREDGLLTPPPWLGTWPWCQVSTEPPESEALPGLQLDPSPLSMSPLWRLFSLDPGLCAPISV